MKHYKLGFYILFISIIWISCGSDEIAPEIQINSPIENTTFSLSQNLIVDALITDNEELDFAVITLNGPSDSIVIRKIELSGDSQSIREEFKLTFQHSGTIVMQVNVVDKSENNTLIESFLNYRAVETGSLDVNIKLKYNDAPLIMFFPYNYPDGRTINFSRCSFYTSQFQLDETLINEVEFHNLTTIHSSAETAPDGYDWTINWIPTGNYNTISFNIGVNQTLNDMVPGDFPSGHPLAKPAENWFSWQSYIFLKVEGNIDLDADEVLETKVALHTGSNVALRTITIDSPIQILEGESTELNLVFDLYDFFNGSDQIYKIDDNPQIHNLSQIDAVIELSDNLVNAIDKI